MKLTLKKKQFLEFKIQIAKKLLEFGKNKKYF